MFGLMCNPEDAALLKQQRGRVCNVLAPDLSRNECSGSAFGQWPGLVGSVYGIPNNKLVMFLKPHALPALRMLRAALGAMSASRRRLGGPAQEAFA